MQTIIKKYKCYFYYGALVFIVTAAIILRFYKLDADLDVKNVNGIIFFGDETWHSGNAIKNILSGQWYLNYRNHFKSHLIIPLIQNALFQTFGLSIQSMRIPAAFFSSLSIIAGVYLMFKRFKVLPIKSTKLAVPEYISIFLFVLLFGFHAVYYGHGRIAMLDIPMSVSGLIGLILFHFSLNAEKRQKGILYALVSGLVLSLCVLIKASGVQFWLILFLYSVFLFRFDRSKFKIVKIHFSMALAFSIATVFVVKYFINRFIIVPDQVYLDSFFSMLLDFNIHHIVQNYINIFRHSFMRENIVILILAWFHIALIFRTKSKIYSYNAIDLLMASYLMGSFLFHGFFNYHPLRLLMVFVFPLTYLSTIFIAKYWAHLKYAYKAILIFLLFAFGARNMYSLLCFQNNLSFNLVSIADQIKTDIRDDLTMNNLKADDLKLYGQLSGILSARNKMDFDNLIPINKKGPIYFFSHYKLTFDNAQGIFEEILSEEKFKKVQLLKVYKYNLFNSQENHLNYLYKID